jgi:hypothetical protein
LNKIARELVVPWSIERINVSKKIPLFTIWLISI